MCVSGGGGGGGRGGGVTIATVPLIQGWTIIIFHGATWETENIVEAWAKRFNPLLHNINCISLFKKK